MKMNKRSLRDALIYDLIFSEKVKFKINIHYYLDNKYDYEDFIEDITEILIKSKVMIVSSEVKILKDDIQWNLTIKK